jgi:hypothetical protein
MGAESSESFERKRPLEKHIGDHLLNFSLFAFLDDDEETRENADSDAISVNYSQFLDSEEESPSSDEPDTEKTPVKEDVVVAELDYEVEWDLMEPRRPLPVTTYTVPPEFLLVPSTSGRLSYVRPIEAEGGGNIHEVRNITLATLIVLGLRR